LNNCIQFDEVNPHDASCHSSYGFHATLLESIETLRLLRLDSLLNRSIAFLARNFSCGSLGWVNRHEFWTRAVGSLIGSFLLTGDRFFLDAAEDCASAVIRSDFSHKFPPVFVNLRSGAVKRRIWCNGTALREVGAGLPELLALFEITGNRTYWRRYSKMARLLVKKSLPLPDILTLPSGFSGTSVRAVDFLTISFYRTLKIANDLRENGFQRILQSAGRLFGYVFDENVSVYYGLIDGIGEMAFAGAGRLVADAAAHYKGDFAAFAPGNSSRIGGFHFDGSALRAFLRQPDRDALIRNAIAASLERCRKPHGFAGAGAAGAVQPSALIGDWLKVGALLDPQYRALVETAVFNERGHVIACRALLRRSP
jgi:hypothetical protein